MPKRRRTVICPRCHRSIPEGKLGEHMRQHKGRLPSGLRVTLSPSKPRIHELKIPPLIPSFNEFFKIYVSQMPVKSNLSEAQMRSKFENALRDVGANYASLTLEATKEPEFIEVFIDEQRNLTLKYNTLSMGTLTEETIDALLLHEACHVVTLPNSLIRVPNTRESQPKYFMANYLTNYDEYLAHVEFVQRFRQDKRYETFRQYQISHFKNFEIIINSVKTGLFRDQRKILEQLQVIVYDALYFYVAADDCFSKWCEEHDLKGLHVFISWIFEDFEHIRKLGLPHEEAHRKVIPSGALSMSVNPLKLIILGQIEFAGTTKVLHNEMMQKGQDIDLVELWEKRRLLYETRA
ncbi:MAG: hypothetical protein AOA66_1221 [Candidatus Bathyarchaeota archaeon BA2]|nr:MAG: hypothetical protein AOA66_1221 [Candidatus Bathyarchaeota archaeon BA2]